jgi:polyferredoxin
MIYKIKALLEVAWMVILPLIISNLVIYLIGSFLAWGWDPREWWLITSTWGRVLAVIIELSIIVNIPKFWEDFEL